MIRRTLAAGVVTLVASPVPALPSQTEIDSAKLTLAAQYVSAHVSCPAGTAMASFQYREGFDITSYRFIDVKPEGSSQPVTVDCSGDQYSLNGTKLTIPELAAYAQATVNRIRAEIAVPTRKHGGGMPIIDGAALHLLESLTPPARSGNEDGK